MTPIKHVVVLMLENRSWDNVLGWLYGNGSPYEAPAGQRDLDGLYEPDGSAKNLSNTLPDGTAIPIANASSATVGRIRVSGTSIPPVDPGEQFGDIAQQILGLPDKPVEQPYGKPGQDACRWAGSSRTTPGSQTKAEAAWTTS